MQRLRKLYVIFFFGVCFVVLGFVVGRSFCIQSIAAKPPIVQAQSSPRLLSVIPNLHLAATRQRLLPIELRRSHLALLATEIDQEDATSPLMDKVLVVPKVFGHTVKSIG